MDRSKKHSAIVVGGPYGAVKEQSAGLYAQTMAERGFVTVAHDPSYNGESGGQPHGLSEKADTAAIKNPPRLSPGCAGPK